MLKAEKDDTIREEYVLDSATLALLEETTTLIRKDGSEEHIGSMTVSYTDPLPDPAAGMRDLLTDAAEGSPRVTVTLKEQGQEDISFTVKKDTLLSIDPGEGRSIRQGKKTVTGSHPAEKDTEYTISS